jgi:ribulose-5-phosphate 4-epimerase/fuculose-1-phosphate aldolase
VINVPPFRHIEVLRLTSAGTHVPVHDILPLYQNGDQQDMLINTERFGSSLAAAFSDDESSSADHSVVLMANHGFSAVGNSIKQAVYRAIYTHINAGVQANAITLRAAQGSESMGNSGLRYLNQRQTIGSQKMNDATEDRPWGLWQREVEVAPLYVNNEI